MAYLLENNVYKNPIYVNINRYTKRANNVKVLDEKGEDTGEVKKCYSFNVVLTAYLDDTKSKEVQLGSIGVSGYEFCVSDIPRGELDNYTGSEMEFIYIKLKSVIEDFGNITDV